MGAGTGILALRAPLKPLHAQPASRAVLLSLAVAGGYITCFLGAGFLASMPLRVACAVALGLFIGLLFRIAHDAGHECHFKGRRLNRIVGWLSHLAPYHPFSLWLHFHNRRHHAFTNLRDRDYIWIPLSKADYDALGPFGRVRERFYRTILGVGAYYLYAIWWKKMSFPRRKDVQKMRIEYILDSIAVLIFLGLQLAALAAGANGFKEFLLSVILAIVVPFVVFNWSIGFVSFLNHTHPEVPWFARREEWSFHAGQVNCTVHMGVPRWMVFFQTDIGLHGAHHIDPRIPISGLNQAEPQIVAEAHEDIVLEKWTWRRHREIMKCCKLYDYDRHQWLDFDGRPTAPRIILAARPMTPSPIA